MRPTRAQVALMLLLSLWAGRAIAQGPPPPPARVPPNASRVVATVLGQSVWPPGSLANTLPLVPADQTFYSLRVDVHAVEAGQPALESFGRRGMVVDAFSEDPLGSDLAGKKIEATLKLAGDTRGVRWWISNVRVLP